MDEPQRVSPIEPSDRRERARLAWERTLAEDPDTNAWEASISAAIKVELDAVEISRLSRIDGVGPGDVRRIVEAFCKGAGLDLWRS